MSEIYLTWEQTHRGFHKPAPEPPSGFPADFYELGPDRWHPDCPFCPDEKPEWA